MHKEVVFVWGVILTDHIPIIHKTFVCLIILPFVFPPFLWFGNYVFLPSIVITSLEERELVALLMLLARYLCPHYVASDFFYSWQSHWEKDTYFHF